MAKKIKLNPSRSKDEHKESFTFEDVLASLPEDVRKEMERQGIKSYEDVMRIMFKQGLDPLKMMATAMMKIPIAGNGTTMRVI